jgi:hypothetical protein
MEFGIRHVPLVPRRNDRMVAAPTLHHYRDCEQHSYHVYLRMGVARRVRASTRGRVDGGGVTDASVGRAVASK